MGWIGIDLDGTLAKTDQSKFSPDSIGAPVPRMVARVKQMLKDGVDVRIFTARLAAPTAGQRNQARLVISEWCTRHLGAALPITATKDYQLIEYWDDRAVQVIPNTGRRADGKD